MKRRAIRYSGKIKKFENSVKNKDERSQAYKK